MIHVPDSVDGRFIPEYFVDPIQRAAFDVLRDGALVADAVDELDRRGDLAAADLVREIAVEEVDDRLTNDREVDSVTAQLVRIACTEALKEVDRDLRIGLVTPDSALAVIREVKLRLGELDGPTSLEAECDLRAWLSAREESRER
jgi:hypothetical protein